MSEDGTGVKAPDREGVICPEPGCGQTFGSQQALRMHQRVHRREQNGTAPRGRDRVNPEGRPSISLKEERDRLVESITIVSGLILPFLPHTALTLISRSVDRQVTIPVPEGIEPPEPIRKKGISTVVMEYAARDPRILRGVVMFNNFAHGSEPLELGLQVAAAAAVDFHVVDPHIKVRMPGSPEPVAIIEGMIGDVIEQVEMSFAGAPEQAPYPGPEEEGATV